MPVLLDYSQVALSSTFAFQNDLKKSSVNKDEAVNIIRHAVLTGVKYYKKKYGHKYGEIILACDGKNSWRKDVFPYYKADRAKNRDKSDLDWKLIFDTISTIRDEISAHFPYTVVCVDRAEGDDVIAAITKWTQTNGMVDHGIFEDKQPVLIVSSDGDFKQLHKYDNVEQWSPIQKKKVECRDPQAHLIEHIVKAGDDGIPNILSPDHVFVTEGIRQNKVTQKKLDRFLAEGRDACENDEQRRNWDRNNTLINFECIPEEIEQRIIDTYINYKPVKDRMKIMNYLIANRCRLLLDELEEF